MLEKNLELFKIFRKRDRNKNFAVSSDEGYVNAYILRGSGLNTLDKKWADEWRDKINKDYSVHKIKKNTFSNTKKPECKKFELSILMLKVTSMKF